MARHRHRSTDRHPSGRAVAGFYGLVLVAELPVEAVAQARRVVADLREDVQNVRLLK